MDVKGSAGEPLEVGGAVEETVSCYRITKTFMNRPRWTYGHSKHGLYGNEHVGNWKKGRPCKTGPKSELN